MFATFLRSYAASFLQIIRNPETLSNDGLIIENMDLSIHLDVSNFLTLPLKFYNPYYHTVNINDIDSHLLQAAHQYKGQARDIFSRTFQIQIYRYFLPNIV